VFVINFVCSYFAAHFKTRKTANYTAALRFLCMREIGPLLLLMLLLLLLLLLTTYDAASRQHQRMQQSD